MCNSYEAKAQILEQLICLGMSRELMGNEQQCKWYHTTYISSTGACTHPGYEGLN